MKLPQFDYKAPASVAEVVSLLEGNEDAKILAGGQSLMPVLAFRLAFPSLLVDMRNVPGLDRIDIDERGVRVGARVRWCEIERDQRLATAQPLLQNMISYVAHTQVRNRGTVGGSLAHADPAAEMPGVALVCDCLVEVEGPTGSRTIPAAELFAGALETTLGPAEVITALRFPPWNEDRRWAFVEVSRRKGDFALAGVAVHFDLAADGTARDVHVGAIGAGSTPLRLSAVEAALEGRRVTPELIAEVRPLAERAARPMSDIHGDADYRRALVGTLTVRAIKKAADLGDA
jgi:aerobic carbon-monoxide dehydrogenase medium subunit